MTLFVKPLKPRITGSDRKGYFCTSGLVWGVGLSAREAYQQWKKRALPRDKRWRDDFTLQN